MDLKELRGAVENSNMETEAKAEIDDILATREWEEEQAGKGNKF